MTILQDDLSAPDTRATRQRLSPDGPGRAEGIRNLLRAPRINPKASTLRALAQFFDVPAGYLLGDQEEPEEQSRRVRVMARSITKLSPAAQEGIAVIIDNLLRVEEAARKNSSDPEAYSQRHPRGERPQ